jgi:hypothetical protein
MTTQSPLPAQRPSGADNSPTADRVRKRVVLHFPGFEPLDAGMHHARYVRAAAQSAKTWNLDLQTGDLQRTEKTAYFDIACRAPDAGDGVTQSRIYVFDHCALVDSLNRKPLLRRILDGYGSALRIVTQGGMTGYLRHAWRFGLFFLFPFLLVAVALGLTAVIAALPALLGLDMLHMLWSIPLGLALFRYAFLPLMARLHTLHLFADWEMADAMANLDRPDVNTWLETCMEGVREALQEDADEYLITSHSMGSAVATHVIGMLLAENPDLFRRGADQSDRKVSFVTLGGAILQCSLLRPAATLRACVGRIARTPGIFWLEVQCLTDSIHFYKSRVVALAGHEDAPQASLVFIRVKKMMSAERYKRIKRDFLRVHRQYVLDSQAKSNFDFTLMTAGPLPAARFANFTPESF